MAATASPLKQDKLIDLLRSKTTLALLLGVFLGWLVFSPVFKTTNQEVLYVTFVNNTNQPLTSLTLDFGSVHTQTQLLSLNLPAQASRTLALNHPAGAGFNVIARYANGKVQDFCANRGIKGQHQQVLLRLD